MWPAATFLCRWLEEQMDDETDLLQLPDGCRAVDMHCLELGAGVCVCVCVYVTSSAFCLWR